MFVKIIQEDLCDVDTSTWYQMPLQAAIAIGQGYQTPDTSADAMFDTPVMRFFKNVTALVVAVMKGEIKTDMVQTCFILPDGRIGVCLNEKTTTTTQQNGGTVQDVAQESFPEPTKESEPVVNQLEQQPTLQPEYQSTAQPDAISTATNNTTSEWTEVPF